MNDFQWQTESGSWEEEAEAPQPARVSPFQVGAVLFVLLVVVLVGGTITRYLQEQTAEAATGATEEVLASFRVIEEAAARGDAELLGTFINDEGRQWGTALIALAQGEPPAAHALLGFMPAGEAGGPPAVTLSPDLTAAELRVGLLYTATLTSGGPQRIRLDQSFWFRHGEQRWILEPGDATFWGESINEELEHISLAYPERDRVLALSIGERIDDAVGQICTTLEGMDCPTEWQPSIQLVVVANRFLTSGTQMVLPAPSLLGQPVDEAGREAMVNAYTNAVASHLIRELVGYECCEQLLFFEAILRKQLSQLGLRDWPPTPADYLEAAGQTPAVGSISIAWFRDELPEGGVPPELYVLVDFILSTNPEATAAALQRELVTAGAYEYERWLRTFFPDQPVGQLQAPWLVFLYRQVEATGGQIGELPEQSLQLMCDNQLYSYLPRSETLSLVQTFPPDLFGRLEQHALLAGDVLLSLPGEGQPIFTRDGPPLLVRGEEQLPLVGITEDFINREVVAVNSPRTRAALRGHNRRTGQEWHWLLDLALCEDGGCRLRMLPGRPVWSPNGERMLIVEEAAWSGSPNERRLLRGNGEGSDLLLVAAMNSARQDFAAPFWIDDQTYGYVGPAEAPPWDGAQLSIAEMQAEGAELVTPVLPIQRLANASDRQIFNPTVTTIVTNPANRLELVLPLYDAGTDITALFLVNWQTGSFRLLYQEDGLSYAFFSPDGRWLAVYGRPVGSQVWKQALYDLENDELQRVGPSSGFDGGPVWSADGGWLVNLYETYFLLMAPEEDGFRYVPLPEGLNCDTAAWRDGL